MKSRTELALGALLAAVLVAFFSAPPLAAQQAEVAGKSDRGFRTFGWKLGLDGLFYEANGKETPLAVYEFARSAFFDSPDNKIITVYRHITDGEGKVVREVVARADVSQAGNTPLVVFNEDPDNKGKYVCVAFADDLTSFPVGSYRFINLSAVALKAGVGERSVVVPAKGQALIRAETDKNLPTRITTILAMINGKPQLIYSNNWVLRPKQRTMVFISAVSGNAEVMRINDVPSVPDQ